MDKHETAVMPAISIALPTSVPLMGDIEVVAKLFGVSKTTIKGLMKAHADLPVVRIGRSVNFLIPDLYVWFRDYPGGKIPTE